MRRAALLMAEDYSSDPDLTSLTAAVLMRI
jgi:hypothetical protein